MLGVFVLLYLNVVLARHFLQPHQAGLFAAANLVAQAAFWLPGFVALAAFPQLAVSRTPRSVLLRAAAVVVSLDGVMVVGLAFLGTTVVRLLFGEAYAPVGPWVWLFALAGCLNALVQLLVYAGIAARDPRMSVLLWLAVAVMAGLVVSTMHGSPVSIVLASVIVTSALILTGLLLRRVGNQSLPATGLARP